MGMTIDDALKQLKNYEYYTPYQELISFVSDWIEQFQSNYETRLKADMVAMLAELQLEIKEIDSGAGYDGNGMPTFATDYVRIKKVNEIIQQRINVLKGE